MDAKENKKNKRNMVIILLIFFGVFLLLILFNFIMDKVNEIPIENEYYAETLPPKANIQFYEADYDYNIFEDAAYMDKNRYIEYTDGAVSVTVTEGDFAFHGGAPLVFFNEYFTAVINGDHEKFNTFFNDYYYEIQNNKPAEDFTMQRLYNINVTKLTESKIESGEHFGKIRYTYKVSYMIMKNDGTFRSDMESDSAVPQIIEILYDDYNDVCTINSVTKYTYLISE